MDFEKHLIERVAEFAASMHTIELQVQALLSDVMLDRGRSSPSAREIIRIAGHIGNAAIATEALHKSTSNSVAA